MTKWLHLPRKLLAPLRIPEDAEREQGLVRVIVGVVILSFITAYSMLRHGSLAPLMAEWSLALAFLTVSAILLAAISLRPGDHTELQEDMVLHVIPGIWQEDWGVEISECIQVTPEGGRALANFQRELIVKD